MFALPETLVDRVVSLQGDRRRIVAVVGAPGSGKSTLAEALAEALSAQGISAAVLPMDGFHYDDALLEAMGLRPRKGAPETFDVAGFSQLLTRLRANDEDQVCVPVFDRALEISRNAARMIPSSVEILIVEGNYLLLDAPGWRDLRKHYDVSVMLDVPEAKLRARLWKRWQDHGIPEAEIPAKVEGNDLRNALTVLTQSLPADLTIPQPSPTL
ncbi:nucleoside/nucleotide kinase family protein [Salipiger sp. 1_MG-2023]|uniref:nucleoside/nucleotide kinase family protein n=1 Tax=Salipiger sp. 1_MG-2023 TaxID=3062665 RepID=UPI0026E396B9|nr:nucleoside/nucleotide kinase family protein [Salipiger sp. 1_MG-2023]MDO6585278.1 nucleoside/nucleotide kinase family protein [Salipiger sp. 1_MG-2023]